MDWLQKLKEAPQELSQKVEQPLQLPPANDGRDLPHYCEPGTCWCSALLPGGDHPAD